MTDATPSTPAGWYNDPSGTLRWWDGTNWGAAAPPPATPTYHPQPTASGPAYAPAPAPAPAEAKNMAIAYVFAVFLGFAGAHNWYLNRWVVAAGQVALTLAVIVCFIAGYGTASLAFLLWVGILGLIIMFVWWLVDLCTLHIRVKLINERARTT